MFIRRFYAVMLVILFLVSPFFCLRLCVSVASFILNAIALCITRFYSIELKRKFKLFTLLFYPRRSLCSWWRHYSLFAIKKFSNIWFQIQRLKTKRKITKMVFIEVNFSVFFLISILFFTSWNVVLQIEAVKAPLCHESDWSFIYCSNDLVV